MMQGGPRSGGRKDRKFDTPTGNKTSKKGPYIVDKTLTPRVKQYLSQFRKGYTPDVDEMTSHLQSRYGEYNRKKRNTFKLSVQKVYQAICRDKSEDSLLQNLEDRFLNRRKKVPSYMQLQDEADGHEKDNEQAPSTKEDDSSDSELSLGDEPLMDAQDTNMMNLSIQSMYKVSTSRPTSGAEDNDGPIIVPSGEDREDMTEMPSSHPQALESTPSHAPIGQDISAFCQTPTSQDDQKMMMDCNKQQETPSTPSASLTQKHNVSSSKRKLNETTEKVDSTPSKTTRKRRRREGSSKDDQEKPAGFSSTQSTVKFSDIGGCEATVEQVTKLLVHMWHPEVFTTLGVTPTTGFLLHGPPGCGKTLLAHAIAGELEMPFLKIAATEIVSGVSGESEEKVRDLFATAMAQAPCVLFLDEIDAITPKRENASKDMERRIVSQLLTCLDDLNGNPDAHVLVIGATNRPDSLDPALRRAGRFDREISMGIPDEKARASVLRVMCKQLKLSADFTFTWLARQTPGYVGADLMALTREAAMIAVNRTFEDLQLNAVVASPPGNSLNNNEMTEQSHNKDNGVNELVTTKQFNVLEWLRNEPPLAPDKLNALCITREDFTSALSVVQPSAKREGFATIPDVTWSDVGALKDVREELTMAILAPVRHPEEFLALGLNHPPGILLAGPPGCGKTLLAKAIANESGINFISVKGPELLNMYVGESERAVRQVFQRARNSAPCVIFFDELDALCPRRSGSAESGSSVRVVNQLLTEMDGVEARKHVFIMAATNRPDIIDPAVMRPGRLDKVLYVGLPNAHDRYDILRTLTKIGTKPCLLPDVQLEELAQDHRCTGFSGADIAALVREASMASLRERIGMTAAHQPTSTAGVHTAAAASTVRGIPEAPSEAPSPAAAGTSLEADTPKAEASDVVAATAGTLAGQTLGVGLRHFERAFDKVRPSVSLKDQAIYEQIRAYAAKL